MVPEGVNYIALLSGALLLVSGSSQRRHFWRPASNGAQSKAKSRAEFRHPGRHSNQVARVAGRPKDEAVDFADKGRSDSDRSLRVLTDDGTRSGSYASIPTPYTGHFFGGHYG